MDGDNLDTCPSLEEISRNLTDQYINRRMTVLYRAARRQMAEKSLLLA